MTSSCEPLSASHTGRSLAKLPGRQRKGKALSNREAECHRRRGYRRQRNGRWTCAGERRSRRGGCLRNRKETKRRSGTRPFTKMNYPSGTAEPSGQLTVLRRRLMDHGGEDTFIMLSSEETSFDCRNKRGSSDFLQWGQWGYFRLEKSEHECVYCSTVFVIVI
jgi:hypothetical protein